MAACWLPRHSSRSTSAATMLSSTFSSETSARSGSPACLGRFVAGFCATILAFAAASEWLVRSEVLPHDTRAAHLRLLKTADTPHAAFGDSHVARGFDAPEGMVNLAFPSENIDVMIAKIAQYFEARPPGRIVLQADPHQFAAYRLDASSGFAAKERRAPGLQIAMPRHRVRLLAYWEAFLRDGGRLETRVDMTENGALLSSGDLSRTPSRKQALEARIRLSMHRPAGAGAVTETKGRFSALVNDLSRRGADLCLVTFPVSGPYRDAEGGQHEALIDYFADEAARVGATHVDARAMVLDPSFFRDVDHLNKAGAAWFTPRLISRCFPDIVTSETE
ncbi:MAG: hypothetical protein R3F54_15345 [Alphaproteobacteria bacterium]